MCIVVANIIKIHEKWHFGRLRLSRKKKWVIGIIITTLLISGSLVAWLVISNQESSQSQITKRKKEIVQLITDADTLANKGDINGAKVAYDSAIKKTEDPYKKSTLIITKATALFNDGKYDDALAVAKGAEAINENDDVTSFIAQTYEKKGDSQNAIKYYQKSITLTDKFSPLADSYIQYYQTKIKVLGGAKD